MRVSDEFLSGTSILRVASVKRDHGIAILTLSNGESHTMPRALLKERPYRSGMPFDESAFRTLIKERSYPFAMDKAVSLLSIRSRTEKEIVDALRRNCYPETTIARVMARLQENGYINDADFAAQFSASRVSRGLGAHRIRAELRKKGVDPLIIDNAIDELDENDQLTSAVKAARKAANGKNPDDPADRQKILAALARRGYGFSLAKEALALLKEETE